MEPNIRFLHSVFEVAHVEYQEYDLDKHKLLFSSGVAEKMLGYSPKEYFGLSENFYKKLVYPDDWQLVRDTCDKLVNSREGEIIEMTLRLRHYSGSYIWVYSRQMVIERKPDGKIKTIVREVEDVTYIIELEDQLKEKVEKLQTVSYHNSHMLRSPVASIVGLVNLVEEHGIGEHNKQIFEYLKQTIKKLDDVIHEINNIADSN
jgi:PAS domain S-box-containing protein